MKPIIRLFLILLLPGPMAQGQVLNLEPKMGPKVDFSPAAQAAFKKCQAIQQKLATISYERLSAADKASLENCPDKESIYDVLGIACDWYCGMGTDPQVTASSTLPPQGRYSYDASQAHDLSYKTAWVEGVPGYGIGEYLEYRFAPEIPRINTIKVVNGFVFTPSVWESNSRVKKLNMYVNGKLFAYLNLKDTSQEQHFSIPAIGYAERSSLEELKKKEGWTIKFEIAEVYKGRIYDDVVISEIYFDGLDVLCLAAGTQITMADGSFKNIEELEVGEEVLSYNRAKGIFESAQVLEMANPIHGHLINLEMANGESITATRDHPFYDGENWLAYDPKKTMRDYTLDKVLALREGSQIMGTQGKLSIQKITRHNIAQPTYTIVRLSRNKTFIANGLVVGTEEIRRPIDRFPTGARE